MFSRTDSALISFRLNLNESLPFEIQRPEPFREPPPQSASRLLVMRSCLSVRHVSVCLPPAPPPPPVCLLPIHLFPLTACSRFRRLSVLCSSVSRCNSSLAGLRTPPRKTGTRFMLVPSRNDGASVDEAREMRRRGGGKEEKT